MSFESFFDMGFSDFCDYNGDNEYRDSRYALVYSFDSEQVAKKFCNQPSYDDVTKRWFVRESYMGPSCNRDFEAIYEDDMILAEEKRQENTWENYRESYADLWRDEEQPPEVIHSAIFSLQEHYMGSLCTLDLHGQDITDRDIKIIEKAIHEWHNTGKFHLEPMQGVTIDYSFQKEPPAQTEAPTMMLFSVP